MENAVRVERDQHFRCEAGHVLYRYYDGGDETRVHRILCPVCDREEVAAVVAAAHADVTAEQYPWLTCNRVTVDPE